MEYPEYRTINYRNPYEADRELNRLAKDGWTVDKMTSAGYNNTEILILMIRWRDESQ